MLAILSTHPIQYQVPLWQALAKDGRVPFEVWYLTDHGTRQSFDREFKQSFAWDLDTLSGYPSRFLKSNKNSDVTHFTQVRLAEPLSDLLREKKVKALWIQGWQVAAYWQAVWQANAMGIPVWLRGESNDLTAGSSWKKPIKQIALRQLFSRVSEFLYIGKANRRLYEKYGVRDEQLHPAYYCVDNERFKRQADELRPRRDELRRQWGIPEDSFCVLFAGKFIQKKRPMDLVNAVAMLQSDGNGRAIHLLFAGSGDLGAQVRGGCNVVYDAEADAIPRRTAISSNGNPAASFTGFLNQTEISRSYVAADCLVLPSDYRETWGLVVNEALASGLPCIVSDACGCGEDLVEPERRYRMGHSSELTQAIRSVINSGDSHRASLPTLTKFDFSASVAASVNLYRSTRRSNADCNPSAIHSI